MFGAILRKGNQVANSIVELSSVLHSVPFPNSQKAAPNSGFSFITYVLRAGYIISAGQGSFFFFLMPVKRWYFLLKNVIKFDDKKGKSEFYCVSCLINNIIYQNKEILFRNIRGR
ncbi:hypothetical protein MNBD_ALPHA02-436 [hydrothermal vent metagenome]|uniref:Uncharacterized protein n=1 Tax=hydrothermal vent metagenome TaxID=652676 RepID=A0A3B0RE17_9ZZZZ